MKRKIYLAVLFATIFAAILCMSTGCKKEPIEISEPEQPQSKMFVVELQSSEPTGPFFGYTLSLNGTDVASPITVTTGDTVKVVVFNPLSNPFILKCYVDNASVYPNGNYQYSDVTWIYIVQ